MSAGYQDIFLNQGETFTTSLSLADPNGNPYDLNYFLVASSAKKSYYSSNATIIFETTVLDANNGIIQLQSSSSVTANLSPGKLIYDVQIKDTISNNVTRVLEGQVLISPAVTLTLS